MLLGQSLLGQTRLGARSSPAAPSGIFITSPSNGQTVGTGLTVSGLTNTAGAVEYRIDGGSWLTLATPSGGDYSGQIAGLAIGTRTLDVRQSDMPTTTASVTLNVVADTITITSPSQFTVIRRAGAPAADINVTVTYLGIPGNVQCRLNRTGSEAWQSFAATASPQNLLLADEAPGWGTIEARFSSDTGVTDTVADVGVGLAIAIWGQSNASGRGSTNQTAPAEGAYLYDNTGAFRRLEDPYDGNFGGAATYSVLDDSTSAGGSWAPRLATRITTTGGDAVLIVPCNKGGTQIGAWSYSPLTTTLFGASVARCIAAGGVDFVLWLQGEADANAGTTEATYTSLCTALVGNIRAAFPSAIVVINRIWHGAWEIDAKVDPIRNAQYTVGTTVTGARLGADLDGITTALHFSTTTELTAVGDAVFAASGFPVAAPISADGSAAASGTATLGAAATMAAAGSAVATGSAALSGGAAISLSASGGAVASGSASLSQGGSTPISAAADGAAQATGTATPSVLANLAAAGSATAAGTALLSDGSVNITPNPMLDAMYKLRPYGLADACFFGQPNFVAFLTTADADYFSAQATSHSLRYRIGVPLDSGEQITVNGFLFKIIGVPRQINADEMTADLVRMPA